MLKKKIVIFYIAGIIFILDRLSKYYILVLSKSVEKLDIAITPFLNFNLIFNKGIAFGLLSVNENFYYNIITLLIISITLIILIMAVKTSGIERYSFSMIFGGSLGNIFDRLYYSAVIDFIDIHINNIHWFIFNFADIFITTGVILLIFFEVYKKKI
tara:strand:+ start:539 stop:1009 length:471 start_codon:yes stop_codon:yes gene_type:complete